MLILDTHILLWSTQGLLKPMEAKILQNEEWSLSAISLFEIEKLYSKGRINLNCKHPLLKSILDQIRIWPVDRNVCESLSLLDFTSDPADEIIAATSYVHDVALLTRDQKILKSKIVPLAI